MMPKSLKQALEKGPIEASAPCRIDMGGTLDISTFYLPLRHFSPCTVNMALDLRTRVLLLPYTGGKVRDFGGLKRLQDQVQQAAGD